MKNANPVFRGARGARHGAIRAVCFAATMLVAGGLAGCNREESAAATPARAMTAQDYFPIEVGGKTVRMQLAIQPREMEQGLMFRRDLGRNDGMIFLYERPQQMGFWMRNTPTPLDIGFFNSEGVLEEVYPMYPFDERAVQSRGDQMRFALEMNQGWYRENGVRVGAKLDLKALAAAVKARGAEPRRYGLRN